MYSKNGGKAEAHSPNQRCESMGSLSYIFVQTCEHSFRRHFKNTRRCDLSLGAINRFAHLPSNSFLTILPMEVNIAGGMKIFSDHVEIGVRAYKLFEVLAAEKEGLCKSVVSLNTVRRMGK